MTSHVADTLRLGRILAIFAIATAAAGIVMAHALLSPPWLPTIIG